jgi:hypothetical protein
VVSQASPLFALQCLKSKLDASKDRRARKRRRGIFQVAGEGFRAQRPVPFARTPAPRWHASCNTLIARTALSKPEIDARNGRRGPPGTRNRVLWTLTFRSGGSGETIAGLNRKSRDANRMDPMPSVFASGQVPCASALPRTIFTVRRVE